MILPPFDKNKELFIWGPVPMRMFYASGMNRAIYEGKVFEKYPDYEWPAPLVLYKEGKCCWINDFSELRAVGKKTFLEGILQKTIRKRITNAFDFCVKKLKKEEINIDKLNLASLSDKDFIKLWNSFHGAVVDFWVPGLIPEIANYGGEEYLRQELSKLIKDETACNKILQVLTAPEELSFYQKEELELLKTKNITLHTKKYSWLKNSYYGVKELPVEFFKERKKEIPKELAKKVKIHLIETKKQKLIIQRKYFLSKKIMNVASALSWGIAWQDNRKGLIFEYIGYKDKLLNELIRRCGLSKDLAVTLDSRELIEHFGGIKDYTNEMNLRVKGFTDYLKRDMQIFYSKDTNYLWDYYLGGTDFGINLSELKGIVASSGKERIVRGRVKLLLDPHSLESIKEGEVLVAPMTSPEYVFAMKKAIAIVTDTGGLTSHAAIVSRELKKPCIVGTKFATKVLQDGDVVEVDANKGIVTILSKETK